MGDAEGGAAHGLTREEIQLEEREEKGLPEEGGEGRVSVILTTPCRAVPKRDKARACTKIIQDVAIFSLSMSTCRRGPS